MQDKTKEKGIMMNLTGIILDHICLIPEMTMHFDLNKKNQIKIIKHAMSHGKNIFIVTKNEHAPKVEIDAEQEDDFSRTLRILSNLYEVGTIAEIKEIMKLPKDGVRVVLEGKARARIVGCHDEDECLIFDLLPIEEKKEEFDEVTKQAYLRTLRELFETYEGVAKSIPMDVFQNMMHMENWAGFMQQLAVNLPMIYFERQKFLEADGLEEQYHVLTKWLVNETDIERIRKDFQKKVKEEVDQNQKEYILREQLKVIHEELGDEDEESDAEEFEKKLADLEASEEIKEGIQKQIRRFGCIPINSAESSVIRSYIETLLQMPWDHVSEDNEDFKKAQRILDKSFYGLEKVKERIVEFLAVRALTKGKGKSPIICLVGPPGVGKTSIARAMAEALHKKYIRISLGGVHDESEIRGHRKTYIGAMPGRIADGLKQAGTKNPLILLDEVDKIGSDYKGNPAAALLEVLDGEQNSTFRDNYIEFPIDLSEVLFIATANTTETIPEPLLDRMELIELSSYTATEKYHIAKEHLFAKQLEENGLMKGQLSIQKKAYFAMINNYTREAGVRSLERKLAQICRRTAKKILEKEAESVKVTESNLEQFLGKQIYFPEERRKENEIGIVTGLAWTSVGGTTLEVEVNIMDGKGELVLTGQLGDVMKESAMTALSYVRSLGIAPLGGDSNSDFFAEHDIHIHVPEGAVPKDGPSAGVTMATAIYSAVTEKKVDCLLAMTGEITLRGRVLPIGGLKEKVLAAKLIGIKKVLVPKENERDIAEIDEEIKDGLEIVFVSQMKEVLKQAIVSV